jgi:hypothetical protein
MNSIERAMHMLDCRDNVERAIVNWMGVMECSRLEAAERVFRDTQDPETQPVGYNHPWPDPDLVEAAGKAYRKAQR